MSTLRVTAVGASANRLVSHPGPEPESLAEFVARGGYADAGPRGEALIDVVEASGLRGRGGAAFPTAIKLRSVAAAAHPRHVVANGEEGEPASVKDRWLLRTRPHLVIDGTLRVAGAVGASQTWVYVSDALSAESIRDALVELAPTPVPVQVVEVEPGYVAGEETAVVRAINGGPAKPTDKPPRPFEIGVNGEPTLVCNVETLAHLSLIATEGVEAFTAVGTERSPGTALLTIAGAFNLPGLYEVELGTPLRQVAAAAGGLVGDPRAFLMGGFFAGMLSARALDLPVAYDELAATGSGLGCGAIIAIADEDCPVAAAARIMAYFARANAGQCGPCIKGTEAMAAALRRAALGEPRDDDCDRLRGWSVSLRGRGSCGTLDGATNVVSTLMREFPRELESHGTSGCTRCATLRDESDHPRTIYGVDY